MWFKRPIIPPLGLPILFFLMCMGVLPTCMSVHHKHAVPMEARKKKRSPETRAKDSCELPGGSQELDLNFLQKCQVLLTTEPRLESQHLHYQCSNTVIS